MPVLLPASYIIFASCCNEPDLQHLHFKLRNPPVAEEELDQRLYLAAEVRYVSQVVRIEEEKRKQEALHQKLLRRKRQLLAQLHMTNAQFARGNRILWNVLLGDYLKFEVPQTRLSSVLERFAVLNRAKEILKANPYAHPEAAFDFCLTNPKGGPTEFRELKTKTLLVFRVEGWRIFQHLTDLEMTRLINTPLEEEARKLGRWEATPSRGLGRGRVSRALVRHHLLEQVGKGLVEEILVHPHCQRHFEAGKNESTIAQEMLDCWGGISDQNDRRVRMEKAFVSRGLPLPKDSIRCAWYVEHKVDYDLDELVSLHYPLKLLQILVGQDRILAREPALLFSFARLT